MGVASWHGVGSVEPKVVLCFPQALRDTCVHHTCPTDMHGHTQKDKETDVLTVHLFTHTHAVGCIWLGPLYKAQVKARGQGKGRKVAWNNLIN